MEKEDARKQVIRMHRKGVGVMKIVAQTGLSWTAVNTALGLYKAEGLGRRLTANQELTIQQTICDRRPEQLKMAFSLWSRPAVRQHIEQTHGIKLSIRAVGKTPVTFAVGGTRHKLSMIATVTNQGKTRWMIIDKAFNSDKLIEFLEALIKDTDRKVFLILDNLRVHHSKPVKVWAAENAQKIELFYLPSYSPELNPEERLNVDLKHVITSKVPVRTKAKLRAAATDHMTMLKQNPERIRCYFGDPKVAYAAS